MYQTTLLVVPLCSALGRGDLRSPPSCEYFQTAPALFTADGGTYSERMCIEVYCNRIIIEDGYTNDMLNILNPMYAPIRIYTVHKIFNVYNAYVHTGYKNI